MKTIYNIHSVRRPDLGRETEEQYFTRLANDRRRQQRSDRRAKMARKLGLRRPERRPAA